MAATRYAPSTHLSPLPGPRFHNHPRADTRKVRDACVVAKGEEHCRKEIEAHNVCLREDGFNV